MEEELTLEVGPKERAPGVGSRSGDDSATREAINEVFDGYGLLTATDVVRLADGDTRRMKIAKPVALSRVHARSGVPESASTHAVDR